MWSIVALILLAGGMLAWRDHRARADRVTTTGRADSLPAQLLDGVP